MTTCVYHTFMYTCGGCACVIRDGIWTTQKVHVRPVNSLKDGEKDISNSLFLLLLLLCRESDVVTMLTVGRCQFRKSKNKMYKNVVLNDCQCWRARSLSTPPDDFDTTPLSLYLRLFYFYSLFFLYMCVETSIDNNNKNMARARLSRNSSLASASPLLLPSLLLLPLTRHFELIQHCR